MAWTDLSGSFAYGSLLTAAQLQHLYGNISEACAGNPGAPKMVESAIAPGAVTSAALALAVSGALVTDGGAHTHAVYQPQVSSTDVVTASIYAGVLDTSLTYIGSYISLNAGQSQLSVCPTDGFYNFVVESSGKAVNYVDYSSYAIILSCGSEGLTSDLWKGGTHWVGSIHSITNSSTVTRKVYYMRVG